MFTRVAIVNRGEAAMRLIHAVRELSAGSGERTETVALYTDADRTATFVREADHAHYLGPASARPYLDLAVLERALVETGADAAWVGWGFVAEDPAFAELCQKLGVTFVGPSADAMRKLGDKIGSKLLAEEVGVPVAPWSRGAVDDVDAALQAANDIGYPLMLKATAGGGGRGIRVITSDDELRDAFERTSAEAARAFGSGVVFLERLVTGARHVEVQVIADGQAAWALGVRDCSIQRRNQKVIEESSSPLLSPEQASELKASAERLAIAVGYRGAATVEFLYHPQEKVFAFLEVNTRLQVEHPITEATTGIDLVKAQLHVAAGGTLDGTAPIERGHAVEARLNAEDPDRDFAPAPGRIALLNLPAGPGIRVDTGVSEGDTIPADFDSMIAKIIAHGRDRDEALARLRRALADTTVVIEGGSTNKSFLLELLDAPEVINASADTGWIDRVREAGRLATTRHSGVAVAAAAIDAYEDAERTERQRLFATAHGGRPQVQHESGRPIDLKLRGHGYRVTVARTQPHRFRVRIDDGISPSITVTSTIERFDGRSGQITVNGHWFRLVTSVYGPIHLVEVDGVAHRISRDEGGVVRSPAPALVVATPVEVGSEVPAGAPVLVLESMKMETVLRAPFRATVRERRVSVGSQVETGAPLLRLEPIGDTVTESATSNGADLELPLEPDAMSPELKAERGLADLRSRLLGFDTDPHDDGQALADYLTAREDLAASGQQPVAGEVELLLVFADLSELSRNRPASEETSADTRVHSSREYFHAFLQTLDVERAGLSETFESRLRRALGHYDVTSLEGGPELEEALFRIFLAQQHAGTDVAVITTVLQQWLTEPAPDHPLRAQVGQILQQLIIATQLRFPVVGDLARSVVFRWFAQPMLRRNRAEIYAKVRSHLRYLEAHPDAPDRDERIADMVASPEPLVRIVGQQIERSDADLGPLLEVVSRRYYRSLGLVNASLQSVAGRACFSGEFELDGEAQRLAATAGDFAELREALHAVVDIATDAGPSAPLVADIYLTWAEQPTDVDTMATELYDVLAAVPLPGHVQRVTTTVAGPSGAAMHHHFTFRRPAASQETGLTEDRLIRGLHPLVAQRFELQRWQNFDLTRLPSADEEVYLFGCAAPGNPADERLVAMAQVRDLTPLRDSQGRVLALPAVEGTLNGCLDAIRTVQASRPVNKRLDTNRVLLYVWPPSELTIDQLRSIARRVVPTTAGAGLEEVLFLGRQRDPETDELTDIAVRISYHTGSGVRVSIDEPSATPIQPLDDYGQKVLRARRRDTAYPYELTDMLAGREGEFTEYDLDDSADERVGTLVPVDRPKGHNKAGIVVGVVTTPTARYPEGVTRVVLLGDPTKALGALSEPECTRVIAALDLAERMGAPVEWFALSAGARISMDSGTENMDWVAAALKRIVQFTQDGREINIVVAGINVGAQPYWNAEATMLMHTKGILVMTPDSAMVLTGKQSLDFSGGVSAEDNFGIGGYDRVMGPNGQAQYWAPNLAGARAVLMAHYDHTYVAPGESQPRRAETTDPADRDVSDYPHNVVGSDFTTVGEIFSTEANPDRKKPFDIRTVMRAVADQDRRVLERWAGMADAETVVVQDVHLGGWPVCMIGIESRSVPRRGFPPTDGPDTYTAGTFFPRSSKKAARAINAASGNRPLVVLANLSGFDGSPESMRKLQLEYGAEIGRAIVNFSGPIVFCVISRYHGGAFVVFSKALNPRMTVLAVDGSYASVLGGAPAAAVVFTGEVNNRTDNDERVRQLRAHVAEAVGAERASLITKLADVRAAVRAEKLGEVATEFDSVHSIRRAVDVGSVDAIIQPADLRPEIIAAIEQAHLAP